MMDIDVFSFLFFLILSSGGNNFDEYAISDNSIHVRFFSIYFLLNVSSRIFCFKNLETFDIIILRKII